MLHDDGFGFAFAEFIVRFAGAEEFGVDIVINRNEAGDEDGVDRSNAGVGRCDDFAGAELVANGLKNESHAKASLEAEMPIFCISIG